MRVLIVGIDSGSVVIDGVETAMALSALRASRTAAGNDDELRAGRVEP